MQHEMMKLQQKEMLMRQREMMSRGGENPWEVGYSKELDEGNATND